jgi:hypothetical protein
MNDAEHMRMLQGRCDLSKPSTNFLKFDSSLFINKLPQRTALNELGNDEEIYIAEFYVVYGRDVRVGKSGKYARLASKSFLFRFRKLSRQWVQYLYGDVALKEVISTLDDSCKTTFAMGPCLERKRTCAFGFPAAGFAVTYSPSAS